MPITSSIIVEDSAQNDGRRSIREKHIDHLGVNHFVTYLAESGTDEEANLANRVAQIEENLKQSEINSNVSKALNGELTFTFNHSTVAQNRTAIREVFRTATRWELITLGWVIHTLNLSDTQLKNLFGVSDANLPALKTKLSNLATRYEEALTLVGQ